MKKVVPFVVVAVAGLLVASTLLPRTSKTGFNTAGFGTLPVLVSGRLKPVDTVARTSLLVLQGRQRIVTPNGYSLTPSEWLLDVLYAPAKADTYRHFLVENQEALDLFGLSTADGDGGKRFSYVQLLKGIAELDRQAKLADEIEAPQRNAFQRQVLVLRERLVLYQRLRTTMQVPEAEGFLRHVIQLDATLSAGANALAARQRGEVHDEAVLTTIGTLVRSFDVAAEAGYLVAIPSSSAAMDLHAWKTPGKALGDAFETGSLDPVSIKYATAGLAWQTGSPNDFNAAVRSLRSWFEERFPIALVKSDSEARFNAAQPFYSSLGLFTAALLAALASWLVWPDVLQRTAFGLVGLAFAVTTAGIITRMWLEGRPPVTNLYSSALFVGWVAVGLCLIIEAVYRNAIATVAASIAGFCALVIAHHLSMGGDTMEMMRAVLDSNFWLATHVVTIAVGYGAAFLAGVLALIYIVRGALTTSLDRTTADGLARMVYGIVCVATLFSFAGTVLGGIWADQAWGRFWGWDPKENGALVIVLWYTLILHARWAGLVRQRGLMNLAIGGNIVTAGSWFGVNMLGVGLHSYGFTGSAAVWLGIFALSQVAVILVGTLPIEKWRSGAALLIGQPPQSHASSARHLPDYEQATQ